VDLDLADKIAVVTGAGRALFEPHAGAIHDGAAKAALLNLPESPAQEFGPRDIRANAISPGPVGTDPWLGEAQAMSRQQPTSPIQTGGLRWSRVPGLG
jgi:NAD(P)-dependent dehydrogenase (short-subunit alcohol dehydrogenase family)